MKLVEWLDDFHNTKKGMLFFGVVTLLITYLFACLAIDMGSFIWYILGLIFFVASLQNFVRLLNAFFPGKATKRR